MLILSREKDESITIEVTHSDGRIEHIEVIIVDVRGSKVRLGINASPSVAVHRKEIFLAIQKQKEAERQEAEAKKGQEEKQKDAENPSTGSSG